MPISSPPARIILPAWRILLPLAAGIALQRLCDTGLWLPLALIAVAVLAYWRLTARTRTPEQRLQRRHYFSLPLLAAAMALGWAAAIISSPPQLSVDQHSNTILTGRISSLSYTDFSMRMAVDITDAQLPPCRVLVTTRGCDYTMRPGDIIAWKARLEQITDMGNPEQMDYARYLLDNEGIRYQQHLPLNKIVKAGHSPSVTSRMAAVRRNLLHKLFDSQLQPQTQHFVAALLLGDRSLIDQSTRQEFSAAGVAHVLALSGLHVGFIAMIIWWLLFPLDYLRLKKLRLVITLGAIALFALFTGMSPSVVRATVMIGCVFASLIFYRRSVSLNALAVAGLLILVFTPSALFQVGFQLSFITVCSILLFARVPEPWRSRYRIVNYITSTFITSLVAMLATMALSAHYFHTVSCLSVVTNLLVLPVMPVIMILGAFFLLVTAAGLQWPVLDWCLDTLCHYIHWAAGAVTALPISHVNGVYVSTWGVVGYFISLIFIALWLYQRKPKLLMAAGIAVILMLAHSLWIEARTPRQGLVIFNSFSSTPILYYEDNTGYLWIPDDEESDSASFSRQYAGFLACHAIRKLHMVTPGRPVTLHGAVIAPPLAQLMSRRMMATSGRLHGGSPRELDDVILTKRFRGPVSRLQESCRFGRIIVSGAMHEPEAVIAEGDSLGIAVHALSVQGALECYP